jgi:hypothetical protein
MASITSGVNAWAIAVSTFPDMTQVHFRRLAMHAERRHNTRRERAATAAGAFARVRLNLTGCGQRGYPAQPGI